MIGIYNYKFFISAFLGGDRYVTYSEYVQDSVGYYYYGILRDSFSMPWRQAVLLEYAAKFTDSDWTVPAVEKRLDDIFEMDLAFCEVTF